ncbi:phage shock protein A [Bacillus pakistanensis]|uniref:Phage shock protein A n=1 Tax=Rossellomorea pakistanensis TaxID=992288 RepID=A0ABS2NJ74_9BACI|nr:PspA/IM30 family protein [Bacillus pakistanensis]MBM7587885.1 phage shock protein A [Bacillus pakistanensis]
MTNLFTRIKNTITADFHDIIDQKEQKNPISLLNQYLRECEQEVEKVRKLVERQYTLKEEFQKEYVQAKDLAEKRKHQSEIASTAGEIELFDFAQREYEYYSERTSLLSTAKEEAEKQLQDLERKYEEMKHKLKDMHIKRMELMGRENIARANHRMNKVLQSTTGYSDKSFSRFNEMESYLDRLEHQVNSSYHRNTIDARIAELEKESKKEETNSIS